MTAHDLLATAVSENDCYTENRNEENPGDGI